MITFSENNFSLFSSNLFHHNSLSLNQYLLALLGFWLKFNPQKRGNKTVL